MADTLNYAILRFVPDAFRGEVVNIGIVVFLPDRLDVRVAVSAHKMRTLNPNVNIEFLHMLEEGLPRLYGPDQSDADRLEVLRSVPLLEVSDLGQFTAASKSYEERVANLMDRFVKTPPARRPPEKLTRLDKELRTAFSASQVLASPGDDIGSHRVVTKFPIAPAEQLYADFALKNGKMHVTAVLDYRVKMESLRAQKRGQAAVKAVTLDAARRKYGDGGCVRYAIYAAEEDAREIIEPQIQMLGDYADRVFDFTSAEDRFTYMDLIVAAAHAQ